jgi:hypothetical protein
MFQGRDLQPHDRNVNDPSLDELKKALGTAYASIDPYRSLMIYDCTQGASWCNQSNFGLCPLLGDALGAAQAQTAGKLWFQSISGNDNLGNDAQGWGGSLCGRSLTLLSVANRMDFAATDDNGSNWHNAELRFVYAARQNFTLILEFVLPAMGWAEFQGLASEWVGLSKINVNDAQFTADLTKAIKATRYNQATMVRIRVNRSHTPQDWRLGEWDLTPGTTLTSLDPSPLDQQLKTSLTASGFSALAAATPPDAKSVKLPTPFYPGIKAYSNMAYGMPLPSGVPANPNNLHVRNMIALQQCTGCHTTETGNDFAHINVGNGAAVLSPFLAGIKTDKPTIDDLYFADCTAGIVSCTKVKYTSDGQYVTRRFHDLGRRLLFLSAVISAPNTSPLDARSLGFINAFATDFSH